MCLSYPGAYRSHSTRACSLASLPDAKMPFAVTRVPFSSVRGRSGRGCHSLMTWRMVAATSASRASASSGERAAVAATQCVM
jgi:hypothetical protein